MGIFEDKSCEISREKATGEIMSSLISELISAKRCDSVNTDPNWDIENLDPLNTVRNLLDFVGNSFNSYDIDHCGKLGSEMVILLFIRIYGKKLNDPLEIYHAFEKHWNALNYNPFTKLNKDEVINFMLSYSENNSSQNSSHSNNQLSSSFRRSKYSKKRDIKIQTKQNPHEILASNETVLNLTTRIAKLESLVSSSKPQTPIQGKPLAQEIILNSIKSSRGKSVGPNEKLYYSQFGHKCNSQYCLLCRANYIQNY